MLKTKTNKNYLKSCMIAATLAVILLLPIFSAIQSTPVAYAAATESFAPESPPISYSYQETRGDIPAGYYVYGVSDEWLLYAEAFKAEIVITVSAEYDDIDEKNNYVDDDEDDNYEREFYGKAPVVAVADFAFAESASTVFCVVNVDLSNAVNLRYIGIHAFANNKITDLDLSPCGNLKEISFGAFFGSTLLRTVQLPKSVSMTDDVFDKCPSIEYIMMQNKDDYARYAAMEEMEYVADLLTYEMEITFDSGGSQTLNETKLFNLPLTFTKIENEWRKTNDSLPDAGFKAGKFGMFAGSTNGTVITEESNATDSVYQIIWITVTKLEVTTNFPSGFATDKSQNTDNLKQYLTVTVYGGGNNEYRRIIPDYSLNFIKGNYSQMSIYVDILDIKKDFDAPITPKDTWYIWIIVTSGIILLAAAAFVIFMKKKKIVTKTVTVTNTVKEIITETIEKEVIKEVPVIKKPLPHDLSKKERQIAEMILCGKSIREISGELGISQGAVTRIYAKAGVIGQKQFIKYFLGSDG